MTTGDGGMAHTCAGMVPLHADLQIDLVNM